MDFDEKTVDISGFEAKMNLDESRYAVGESCRASFNTRVDNGILRQGQGIKKLSLPLFRDDPSYQFRMEEQEFKFRKLWHYSYYSEYNHEQEYLMIAYGEDGKLYFSSIFDHAGTFINFVNTAHSMPSAINFTVEEDSVIGFAFEDSPLLVWYCDDDVYEVEDAPNFRSICLHGDRLFAIDATKDNVVRYSSNKNPLDWIKNVVSGDDADKIELNDYKGNLRNLVSFKDGVYVFMDYAIAKISAYAGVDGYFSTTIYNSGSKIYANTACVCGENMYFLCQDGLYYTDGIDVVKADIKFTRLFSSEQNDANTCFFKNKLYIACRLDFDRVDENNLANEVEIDDLLPQVQTQSLVQNTESLLEEGYINNAIIEYNTLDGTYSIVKGIDACSMLAVNDLTVAKVIIAVRGKKFLYEFRPLVCEFDDEETECSWESGTITLDSIDKDKILKEIYVSTLFDVQIEIKSDKGKRVLKVEKGENASRVIVNLPGKEFKVKILNVGGKMFVEKLQMRFLIEK